GRAITTATAGPISRRTSSPRARGTSCFQERNTRQRSRRTWADPITCRFRGTPDRGRSYASLRVRRKHRHRCRPVRVVHPAVRIQLHDDDHEELGWIGLCAGASVSVTRSASAQGKSMRYYTAVVTLVGASFLSSGAAFAQFTQQGSKLVGTGATGAATQGASVSLSSDGNTALVGGHFDDGSTGATWVFTRSGATWTQQGSKLIGSGAVGAADQGRAVALSADGNTAIVGGSSDDSRAGGAWVLVRSGATWPQQGSKLVGTAAGGAAGQGTSVALSADGNTAIVGGSADSSAVGAAWIFVRSGSAWTQQGSKLVGTGAGGAASEGISVALSADGNTAAVGGDFDE